MRTFLIVLLAGLMTAQAQNKETAIRLAKETAFNYIDTFYKADTTLAYKAVHKDLRKVGWWYSEEKGQYSDKLEMPFNDLISLAKKWNADGSRPIADSPREVHILEVNDKIAVVKVIALWGIDYLNMVWEEDQWKIINIIWQSAPKYTLNQY